MSRYADRRRTEFGEQPWVPFRNTGTWIVEPFGVLMVRGFVDDPAGADVLSEIVLDALKCGTASNVLPDALAVNGGAQVKQAEFGLCVRHVPGAFVTVRCDTSEGAIQVGETWGPKWNSFLLQRGMPGFRIRKVLSASDGLCIAECTQFDMFRGKLGSSGLGYATEVSCEIHRQGVDSPATTFTCTAIDKHLLKESGTGSTVAANSNVLLHRLGCPSGKLAVIGARCP